jgi:hypothetical protein
MMKILILKIIMRRRKKKKIIFLMKIGTKDFWDFFMNKIKSILKYLPLRLEFMMSFLTFSIIKLQI